MSKGSDCTGNEEDRYARDRSVLEAAHAKLIAGCHAALEEAKRRGIKPKVHYYTEKTIPHTYDKCLGAEYGTMGERRQAMKRKKVMPLQDAPWKDDDGTPISGKDYIKKAMQEYGEKVGKAPPKEKGLL